MSVEAWKSIADWSTIVLIALTVVSGSAALILGDRINEKQAEQLRKFNEELIGAREREAEAEIELQNLKKDSANALKEVAQARTEQAKAQKESAEAQLALKKYIDDVAKRQGRRLIDHLPFLAALKERPKGKCIIMFKQNDSEAYLFSLQVRRWLGPGDGGDGAGWEVTEPVSFPTDVGLAGAGSSSGMTIVVKDATSIMDNKSFVSALIDAFSTGSNVGGGFVTTSDPSLSPDVVRLMIGQKP